MSWWLVVIVGCIISGLMWDKVAADTVKRILLHLHHATSWTISPATNLHTLNDIMLLNMCVLCLMLDSEFSSWRFVLLLWQPFWLSKLYGVGLLAFLLDCLVCIVFAYAWIKVKYLPRHRDFMRWWWPLFLFPQLNNNFIRCETMDMQITYCTVCLVWFI